MDIDIKNCRRALYGYIRKFLAYPSLETFWAFAHYTSKGGGSEEFFKLVCDDDRGSPTHCYECPFQDEFNLLGLSICEIIENQDCDDTFEDCWKEYQGEIVIAISRLHEWLKIRYRKGGPM